MTKACLNKISRNILQRCTIPSVGIKEIYLIYPEDFTFGYNEDGSWIISPRFAEGARSYKVEGYKQNIQVSTSLRSLDASAKLDVSVTFKLDSKERYTWRSILTGRFYVMVEYNDAANPTSFIGLTSPLEVTAADYDSNAGAGLVTVTLGTPEGSAGNYIITASEVARDLVISKSV